MAVVFHHFVVGLEEVEVVMLLDAASSLEDDWVMVAV